jgi:hypothetical protein
MGVLSGHRCETEEEGKTDRSLSLVYACTEPALEIFFAFIKQSIQYGIPNTSCCLLFSLISSR